MPGAVSVLEYSSGTAGAVRRRRRWIWAVLSLPLFVVPFVPFACKASPMGAVIEGAEHGPSIDRESFLLVMIAMPLVLGAVVGLWQARMLWRTSATERLAAQVVGLVMAGCAVLSLAILSGTSGSLERKEWLILIASFVVLLASAAIWVRLWRRRRRGNPDDLAVAALLAGYVPAATLALLMFWDDREMGWYLTLYCAIVGSTQLALLAAAAREKPA
jgi:uncharacterized membrane protein